MALWTHDPTSYSGEKSDMFLEDLLNVLHHLYSKEYVKKKTRVRDKVQQYPNKHLEDAIMDKLEDDDNTKLLHFV